MDNLYATVTSNLTPFVIKSVDGQQFGFIVFKENECVKSVLPCYKTCKEAEIKMNKWVEENKNIKRENV